MSSPRNLYNNDSDIVPPGSPASEHETAQSIGSDDETAVEWWSDEDTTVESEGEEEEVRMVIVEHDDDNSDEEFRLLHGLDNGGWGEASDDQWDRDLPAPSI